MNFNFDNAPRKFIDLETGQEINIFADTIKDAYEEKVNAYFKDLAMTCAQNKIKYVPVAVEESFEKILLKIEKKGGKDEIERLLKEMMKDVTEKNLCKA